MNGRMLAMIAGLLAVIAIALQAAPRVNDTSAGSYASEGYGRAVQLFIDNGWLTTAGRNVVELSASGQADPDAVLFYRQSFLVADVARNDPSLWVIDSVLLGVSPFAHMVTSPFATDRWNGDLTVSEAVSVVELVRGDSQLVLRLGPKRIGAPEDLTGEAVNVFGEPAEVRSGLMQLYVGDGRLANDRVASVELIGTTPVMTVWSNSNYARVRIDQDALPSGARVALEPGTVVTVEHGGAQVTYRVNLASTGALSVLQPLGERRRDPTLEPIAVRFEQAMDAAVARNPGLRDQDYVASIDMAAQQAVQRQLEHHMSGSSAPGAVTVMDALHGDVLVLASTPAPAAAQAQPGVSASRRYRDVINYNFQPMAVGSAAKPLIAAAILTHTPSLLDLQVLETANRCVPGERACHMEQLLGVRFGGPPGDQPTEESGIAPGHWITLEEFIQYSSNRYATSLALLGMSPQPLAANSAVPSHGSFRIGVDQPPAVLPTFNFRIETDAHGAAVLGARTGAVPWRDALATLYDLGECTRETPASCGGRIWRPASDPLQAVNGAALFGAISPQAQDFNFDLVADVRRDYLPVVLGGENYGWSTMKLAESYSRLVTGRRLRARLLEPSPSTAAAQLPDRISDDDLDPEVRRRVLAGMTLVTERHGTALRYPGVSDMLRRLRAEAERRQERIVFYSKTGTPEVEEHIFTRQEQAENELIRAGLISRRNGDMQVVGAAPRTSAESREAARRLAADPRARAILARLGARAGAAAARATRFNAASRDDARGYRMRNGIVVEVTPEASPIIHFASAYVIVAVVYSTDPAQVQPLRAYAVAVNLQHDRHDAPTLAAYVLQNVVFDLLFPSRARP